jgi:hypothetical protein
MSVLHCKVFGVLGNVRVDDGLENSGSFLVCLDGFVNN